MYLPILQDPAQFVQPVGGMTNFSFDLLFDRSREVASRSVKASNIYDSKTEIQVSSPADLGGEPEYTDPADIGVLADLRVLYSIIGQGFSADLINLQRNRFISAAQRQANAQASEEEGAIDVNNIEGLEDNNFLSEDVNLGNSAFLIQFPVRIIFSSLFMIDGFISGTTVDFLKFSTKMVPLQARVGLNVQAMYIGFARERTVLSQSLEDAQDVIAADIATATAQKQELSDALTSSGSSFVLGFSSNRDWTKGATGDPSIIVNVPTYSLGLNQYEFQFEKLGNTTILSDYIRGVKAGFNSITPQDTEGDEDDVNRPIDQRRPYNDKILALIRSGGVSAEYTWSVNLYGPYTTEQLATQSLSSPSSDLLVGTYQGTHRASSKEEWGYKPSNTPGIRRLELGNGGTGSNNEGPLANSASKAKNSTLLSEEERLALYDGYYIAKSTVDFTLTATVGAAKESETRRDTATKVVRGPDPLFFSFSFLRSGG